MSAALSQNPTTRSLTVLIVEDDPGTASMLTRAVALGGHAAHAFPDGEQALAFAAQTTPDVAVIDIGLPGIDGHTVATELRKINHNIFTIIATGRSSNEEILRSRAAGCDYHWVKPIDLTLLLSTINDWKARLARSG